MGFRDPDLIHPIPVKLKLKREDETLWDNESREPIGNIAGDPTDGLVAQVSWKSAEIIADEQGSVERMDGYLLFLRKDLKEKEITINEGDRILSVGEGDALEEMASWVWKTQLRGHYQSTRNSGYTMLKAWFKDKKPVLH